MVTVLKSTIRANVYKNFYDLINAISGFSGNVYPKYGDKVRDSVDDYPAIIINPARVPKPEDLTVTKGKIIGTIMIDVFATNDKDADQYADSIDHKIGSSRHILSQQGIRKVELEDDDDDIDVRGKIKGFVKTLIYRFEFYFTKPSVGF